MGTANITKWVDVSGGTASISAIINTLAPGTNKRVGVIQMGNVARFYVYDIA
jgi:hypothetical protein